jgi:hypothetical protein
VQVPVLLLQVWHCPGQSVWQQTPSDVEQTPDEHSVPEEHVFPAPLAFFKAQLPLDAQYCPAGQEVDVQAPAHLPLPSVVHAPLGHAAELWVGQVPVPLQYETGVC